jgi:hypothetical protein
MTTKTSTMAQITKGHHKGAWVKPCHDSMECPFYEGANGERVIIAYIVLNGEKGRILALKDNELRWL